MVLKEIVLASASPRRKELLNQLGLEFRVQAALKDEIQIGGTPTEISCHLAKNKALEVAESIQCSSTEAILVIGADTIVVSEGKLLGKPKDEKEAVKMLNQLSGKKHSVFTGVALVLIQGMKYDIVDLFAEETIVSVFDMTQDEIMGYVQTKDPMDKAGAYGIQGMFARYIKGVEGEYCNVMGLPIGHLWQSLKNKGIVKC